MTKPTSDGLLPRGVLNQLPSSPRSTLPVRDAKLSVN
jgi:hypothetical protein